MSFVEVLSLATGSFLYVGIIYNGHYFLSLIMDVIHYLPLTLYQPITHNIFAATQILQALVFFHS